MLLIVGIGTFAAALCTGCGGTFCDEYPEACENVGGGGGGEEGPNIDGVLQSGAILCADCAASPFCYDMAQDPPLFVYLENETDLCPGALFKAEPAIR